MNFPWIKRPDLIFQAHDTGGWLLKDPLTLTYTLLDNAEFQILQLLDGTRTLPEILKRARRWVPDRELTIDDIGHFVQTLAGQQLVRRLTPGDAQRLHPQRSASWLMKALRLLMNILRIQIPLVNPSRAIDRVLPAIDFVFRPAFRRLATIVMVIASLLVFTNFGRIVEQMPTIDQFLGPANLFLMLISFVLVKILHEAGHAVSARYFGAECNECGIMLMILTPVLYTNVTDGWRLPRHQRMQITAAGILVELFIASVATILWWQSSPGITRSLLLNIMLLCSVNTILFNGNPLLRFDGYFLLSDWWRLPNLSSRASAVLHDAVVRLVTGSDEHSDESSAVRRTLLYYGLAAAVYRIFLSLAILQFILHLTREANIEILGSVISSVLLVSVLLIPGLRFANDIVAAITDRVEAGHGWVRPAVMVGLPVAVLLTPLPTSTIAPSSVESNGAAVYLQLPGQLTPLIPYGETVIEGEPLASIRNLRLTRTKAELAGRVSDLSEQIETLTNNPRTADSPLLPTLQTALRTAEADLKRFNEELQRQIVTSPASGILWPPLNRPENTDDSLPDFWSGLPLATINTSAWMQRGTSVGYVGPRDDLKLTCCVSESEVAAIRAGQSTLFLPLGADRPIPAEILEVAGMPSEHVASRFGIAGLLSGTPADQGWRPAETTYVVTARLAVDADDPPPALHTVGHVRIFTEPTSLARRVFRYLRRTFS